MKRYRCRPLWALALAALLLGGCAANPEQPGANHYPDPLEPANRVSYRVHTVGDDYAFRPVARGYQNVTPSPARNAIGNFFNNLGAPATVLNSLLQGKISQAVDDTGRFVLNSTVGVLGFVDVASRAGLEDSEEDFGTTLARWGSPSGPYLFVPLAGPTTLRDGVGMVVDAFANPISYGSWLVRTGTAALYGVHVRAGLLNFDSTIESAADPYAFIRNAYWQRREFVIHDGAPPADDDPYDMYGIDDLDDPDELPPLD